MPHPALHDLLHCLVHAGSEQVKQRSNHFDTNLESIPTHYQPYRKHHMD